MAAKPAVQVVIAGDTKDLDKALKHSAGGLKTFGSTAAGVFGGLAIAKGIGLAVDGIQALGGFALGGVDKLDALGDATARLDGLAKGLGKTAAAADLSRFGVDKNEQADAALSIAKTGKALGLTGKQVSAITPDLQKMAGQLASLGDGNVAGQADLIAKALGGSAKAAKALGVELPKGNTPLQNYKVLMSKLGPQLDKATAGQASLADVGERWDATLSNLQLQLAGFLEKLAPVVSALLDALLPALQQLVDTVGPAVEEVFGNIAAALASFLEGGGAQQIAGIFTTIGSALGTIGAFIAGTVVPAFQAMVTLFVEHVLPVLLAIADGVAKNIEPLLPKVAALADALFAAFNDLLPILSDVWDFIGENLVPILVKDVFPILSNIAGIVLDLATAFVTNLVPAIRAIATKFGELMTFLQPVFDILSNIAGLAGDVIGTLSNIHIPGINLAAAPGTQAAGVPMNVTIQTGVGDPVAIGRQVARYLSAYQLRGGSVA